VLKYKSAGQKCFEHGWN